MMISTKGRYALRVMLDLAGHQADGLISLREIASRQNISPKYLERIVAVLSKSGFLLAQQGKNGGYRLAKKPEEYTIAEILELTDGSLAPVECMAKEKNNCPRAEYCQTLPLWGELDKVIRDFLQSRTLADLMQNH